MYIETHTYRIGGWSSHPDKGSGVMKWVLVKWPKEPVSKVPLETGFKSESKRFSCTDAFHVHSQLYSPVS